MSVDATKGRGWGGMLLLWGRVQEDRSYLVGDSLANAC
jgi:hypothetical protein